MPLENLSELEAEWAVFMEDKPGARGNWTQDQRWRADNPGELAALKAYRDGGAKPTTIVTATGRRMVEHVGAYLEAKGTEEPPPIDPPPPVGTAPWKGSFDASYQAAPLGSVISVPAGTYPGEVIRWRPSAAQKAGQMIKFTMGGAVTLTGPLEVRGSAVWVDGGNKLTVKGYVDTEADSVTNHPDNVILENLKCVSLGVFNAEKVTCRKIDVGPATTYCSNGSQIVAREGRGFECKIGFAGGITYVPKDILFDGVKIHNQNGDETRLQSGCDIHFGGLFLVTADGLTLRDCVFERNVVYHIQIQNFGGAPPAKRVLIDHCSFGAPVDWLYKGDIPDNQRAVQFDYDPGTEFTIQNTVCANGQDGLYGCYVGDCGGLVGVKTSGNKNLAVSTTAPPLL